jgi:formylmethanofuran dehydrogenase subunit E
MKTDKNHEHVMFETGDVDNRSPEVRTTAIETVCDICRQPILESEVRIYERPGASQYAGLVVCKPCYINPAPYPELDLTPKPPAGRPLGDSHEPFKGRR